MSWASSAGPFTGGRPSGPVAPGGDTTPPEGGSPAPASMFLRVQLTKLEVFGACQALADADPVLVAAGHADEARALGDLFELLEDRLTGTSPPVGAVLRGPSGCGDCRAQEDSGRNSMDRELTQ